MVQAEGSGRPGEAAGLVLPLSVSQVGVSTGSSACDSVEAPRSMVGRAAVSRGVASAAFSVTGRLPACGAWETDGSRVGVI